MNIKLLEVIFIKFVGSESTGCQCQWGSFLNKDVALLMPFKDMMLHITPGMAKIIAARYTILYGVLFLVVGMHCLDNPKLYLKKFVYFVSSLATILSPCLFCAP